MVEDGATFFLETLNLERAPKSHYWFKSYGDFTEWMDLAYCLSFSDGGSVINGAYPV